MQGKVSIYKAACYVNLVSMAGVVSQVIWQMYTAFIRPSVSFKGMPGEEFIVTMIFFLVVGIYVANGYWGIKLVSYLRQGAAEKPGINRRVIFWIFEILLGLFYSVMIYTMVTETRINSLWPMNPNNLMRLVFLISFTCGYISSVTRIFLTWPMINLANRKARAAIEEIGMG